MNTSTPDAAAKAARDFREKSPGEFRQAHFHHWVFQETWGYGQGQAGGEFFGFINFRQDVFCLRATPAGDFYQYWASRAFLEKALHHRTGSGNRRSLQPGLETLLDLSACDPGFLQALPHRRIHPGTLLWEGEFQRTFYNSWTQAG